MRFFALALLVAAGGCQNRQCAPGKGAIEIRDASGALTLALKGDSLCDSHDRRVATLTTRPDGVTLKDPAGNVSLELTRESDAVAQGRDQKGPRLRLYRDAREFRVLKADGVPFGSIVPDGPASTIYNQASSPLGRVSMRDRDAVVTDMGGSAQTYVIRAAAAPPAGVFGIPGLQPAEQLTIYMYWSR